MKLRVTQKGVYDNKGERVEVGTILPVEVKNKSEIPSFLLNKCETIGEAPEEAEGVIAEGDGKDKDSKPPKK